MSPASTVLSIPTTTPLRTLVVGCGNMGASHALAYDAIDGYVLCGLVARGRSKVDLNARLAKPVPLFDDYETALRELRPDVVCIASYPDTHEAFALRALEAGCHVFVEKPLATTVEGTRRLIAAALAANRQLMVGYVLRQHPSWQRFIAEAQRLGKPLVMRMNLNQQSSGLAWQKHRAILDTLSPVVDCGVHYIDVMCQMTGATPVRVSAIGAALASDLAPGTLNYGQLQVCFSDGSIGWYEAGWGPMISETAFFVKDVMGPRGSVSIVADGVARGRSADIAAHTETQRLLVHCGELDAEGRLVEADRELSCEDEPDHDGLCALEQRHFLARIHSGEPDYEHWNSVVDSLRVVLAADESMRTGMMQYLEPVERFMPEEAHR
ncbi:Gfo/Idh/MocA family protein [Paraburkholderia sp. BCC1886]|uniref:Gfo/Idh/MocA family protein n=1 Tax=Paraburkholderia sp. BCC1886 TaxID=2562670 RepID=UPI0011830058|nr:Gfo/Idh/MocA family oxidoreductase [Paraburkholderia sp. BCC1886]